MRRGSGMGGEGLGQHPLFGGFGQEPVEKAVRQTGLGCALDVSPVVPVHGLVEGPTVGPADRPQEPVSPVAQADRVDGAGSCRSRQYLLRLLLVGDRRVARAAPGSAMADIMNTVVWPKSYTAAIHGASRPATPGLQVRSPPTGDGPPPSAADTT
jgi:hypothetical protein